MCYCDPAQVEGWAIMRTDTRLNAQSRPENGLFSTHTMLQQPNVMLRYLTPNSCETTYKPSHATVAM